MSSLSLDQQIDELVALLDSQLASELDPLIRETLQATRAAVIARGDAALTDKMMVATNYTYQSIREMMEKQAGGLVGLHEDVTGFIRQREEQDDASQRAIQQQAKALARIEQQNADQLRIAKEGAAAFQTLAAEFSTIAEGFTGLATTVGEHTEQIAWLATMARAQEGRIVEVVERVDRHDVKIAEGELERTRLAQRVKTLEGTIKQLQIHLKDLIADA
jgi:hypothetical protein